MSVTVKNPVIKNKFINARKPPLKQALNVIKKELVAETTQRGWQRFKTGIETAEDSATTGRVFVNNAVTGSGTASNTQIGAWLHYGRGWVYPVKAQVLRWFSGGQAVFSKRSKPTKATNWWGLKETIKVKIRKLFHRDNGK